MCSPAGSITPTCPCINLKHCLTPPRFFPSVDDSLEVDDSEGAAPAPGGGGPAALTFRRAPSRLPALAADEYQNPANPCSAQISQRPVIAVREIRLRQIQQPADICRRAELQGSPAPAPTSPRHCGCSHGSNQTL